MNSLRFLGLSCLLLLLVLLSPAGGAAGFDTGLLKVELGAADNGFIDAVWLDRNGDGFYQDDERLVLHPDGMPGLVVAYTVTEAEDAEGVAVGPTLTGAVDVQDVQVEGLTARLRGELDFGSRGRTPFEVRIRGRSGSDLLEVGFEFAPLSGENLLLREATLRLYTDLEAREPNRDLRMSSGRIRITPRPDSSRQPMVWQVGGDLVESPWYWREWFGWSDATGPLTRREGHTPARNLAFFIRDEQKGIQALIKEPAAVAPVELAGSGYPTYLALHAWTPRVPGRPLTGSLPARFALDGVWLHFFDTGSMQDEDSRRVLDEAATAARSNLTDPRLPADLMQRRLDELSRRSSRGWEAQIAATALPAAPVVPAGPGYGPGWLTLQLASEAGGLLPRPVQSGIPFPRGALESAEHLRLLDEQERELPLQVDTLALWPDGSLKWVLLTTLVPPGSGETLRVEYGSQVQQQAPAPGVLDYWRDGEAITVDTGPLRFSLDPGGGLFKQVWLDDNGDGRFDDRERLLATDGGSEHRMDLATLPTREAYGPYSFHAQEVGLEPSRVEVEDITVEREGPLSLHLLVKGRYHYAELGRGRGENYRNEGNPFWIRYTAYAGQPYLQIKHSYVFEGNPERELVRDLSLSLDLRLEQELTLTTTLDGESRRLNLGQDGSAGLLQDNPAAISLWQGTQGRIEAMGQDSGGWLDIADGQRGVTLGLHRMRQRYAKALTVEDGRLVAGLWPRRARYLDTRRYARQYGQGESSSFGLGVAQGVSRSHDLVLYFHPATAERAASGAVAEALLQPARLIAHPQWYVDSRVIGPLSRHDPDDPRGWDPMLVDGLDYMLYHRELWSWYGLYDDGDLQQRPHSSGGGWTKRLGRWGWVNNEALVDMWIYQQFLRTGHLDYLEAALDMTRHVQEVDLINTHNYKGNTSVFMHGHRHNVNHWGDGFVGVRVAAPLGFRLGYYLTGDLRILDQLRMGMEAHWSSVHTYDKQHAAGLGHLLTWWEMTGDYRYWQALEAYLDYQEAHFERFGHLHHGVWDFAEPLEKLKEKPLSGSPVSSFFQNFGTAYALMELAELTGREGLIQALVALARDTERKRRDDWSSAYCHYRLMAFAYRHSGNPLFRDYALKKAERLRVPSQRKQWATSSALDRFDRKLSMLVWSGQGLPYLDKALELRRHDPQLSLQAPQWAAIPAGQRLAAVSVDAGGSRAREGRLVSHEWWVDGERLSQQVRDTLKLPPGEHQLELRVEDDQGRQVRARQSLVVWEPGTVARICFRQPAKGFQKPGRFDKTAALGYTGGTRYRNTHEPRRYGDLGCREIYITGTLLVRTGPGRFQVEMGGRDFWTKRQGRVKVQDRPLDLEDRLPESKKLEWGWTGTVEVGVDGLLRLEFLPGPQGEQVVLGPVIIRQVQ